MTQSVNAIKMEGIISVIGVLTGTTSKETLMETLARVIVVRGVYVGGKDQLEEMIKAMEEHDIHPVVDEKVFTLETAKEAYEYMVSYSVRNPALILADNAIVGGEALWQGWYQDRVGLRPKDLRTGTMYWFESSRADDDGLKMVLDGT